MDDFQSHLANGIGCMLLRFSPADAHRIAMAGEYAETVHRGRWRKVSGQPFIVHPIGVATILAEAGFGVDAVIAGLLHDAVEDSTATRADVEGRFGAHVWSLVAGVTNGHCLGSWRERKRHALLRLSGVPADCLAVKCADAIDNVRSISCDLDGFGDVVWQCLRPKPQLKWYFESLLRLFDNRLCDARGQRLVAHFGSQVKAVFGE